MEHASPVSPRACSRTPVPTDAKKVVLGPKGWVSAACWASIEEHTKIPQHCDSKTPELSGLFPEPILWGTPISFIQEVKGVRFVPLVDTGKE